MPEPVTSTTSDDGNDVPDRQDCTTEHTCACGEKHRHRPGMPSHSESCTSPLKFGESCCCGSGNTPEGDQHRCGHGPKCH